MFSTNTQLFNTVIFLQHEEHEELLFICSFLFPVITDGKAHKINKLLSVVHKYFTNVNMCVTMMVWKIKRNWKLRRVYTCPCPCLREHVLVIPVSVCCKTWGSYFIILIKVSTFAFFSSNVFPHSYLTNCGLTDNPEAILTEEQSASYCFHLSLWSGAKVVMHCSVRIFSIL